MDSIEMWRKADEVDAEIGGMDSVPEWEKEDYQQGLLIRFADDFKYGQEVKERRRLDASIS